MDKDTPEGIAAFKEMMQHNTTLTRLSAPGSNETEVVAFIDRNNRIRLQH